MKRCALIPKDGNGGTWYCRVDEIFKKYAHAYSLDGYQRLIRTDRYFIVDATHDRSVAALLASKPLFR